VQEKRLGNVRFFFIYFKKFRWLFMGLRRAVFLRFALALWAFLLMGTLFFYLQKVVLVGSDLERKQDLELQSKVAQSYLLQGQSKDLVEYLRSELRSGKLGFFSWKKEGNWVASEGYRRGDWEGLRANGVEQIDGAIVTRLDSGGYELFLGHETGIRTELRQLWIRDRSFLYKDALLLCLGLFLIGVFFFRDIALRVLHAPLSEGGSGSLRESRMVPAPKAIRHAKMESEENKPYLLLYTSPDLFLSGGAERVHQLCKRYEGEILRMEEDFVVIQFNHSLFEAVACMRDLADPKGKGSVVAGSATLEEWRGLRMITGASFRRAKEVHGTQIQPCFIEGDCSLFGRGRGGAIQWSRLDEAFTEPGQLRYFRTDEAGREFLAHLAIADEKQFDFILSELRHVSLNSRDLSSSFDTLLNLFIQKGDTKRLSEIVSLAPHLLSGDSISAGTEKALVGLLKHSHQRVRSNAVECLTNLFPFREFQELRILQRDQDQRIAANALIKRAIERLDEEVVSLLAERLSKGSANAVASSLYALGEIAQYYRSSSPQVLVRNRKFEHLLEELAHWSQHPNPMVQRQALWAAEKAGRELPSIAPSSKVQEDFKAA
jgi:hypothetical protein